MPGAPKDQPALENVSVEGSTALDGALSGKPIITTTMESAATAKPGAYPAFPVPSGGLTAAIGANTLRALATPTVRPAARDSLRFADALASVSVFKDAAALRLDTSVLALAAQASTAAAAFKNAAAFKLHDPSTHLGAAHAFDLASALKLADSTAFRVIAETSAAASAFKLVDTSAHLGAAQAFDLASTFNQAAAFKLGDTAAFQVAAHASALVSMRSDATALRLAYDSSVASQVASAGIALASTARASMDLSLTAAALRLPDRPMIDSLSIAIAGVVKSPQLALASGDWSALLATRMSALKTPWLLPDAPEASALGFGRLAALRDLVAINPPFAPRVREAVFERLGEVVIPADNDSGDRIEARHDLGGRDAALVAFPDASYPLVVEAAGFRFSIPAAPTPAPEDGTDAYFDRDHHALVAQLEQHLRNLIARVLQAEVGEGWSKSRVPGQIRTAWQERRDQAVDRGDSPFPLIQYADLGHLSEIMAQSNNWKLFRPYFRHKESMQESFRRLMPIRNSIAHCRPLTPTQILELAAESLRVFRAIGIDVLRH